MFTRHLTAGPPMPTGMGCFLPHMPELAQIISSDSMSTVLSMSKATPEMVVSRSGRPSFPF